MFCPYVVHRRQLVRSSGDLKLVLQNARQYAGIYDVWQRNYYEHIIRDGNDYDRIANYIFDNPMNWEQDELYHAI